MITAPLSPAPYAPNAERDGAREDADRGAGDQPRVSIVLIFLDEERFLGEAIASVFAQTYTHWELLLIDDGSHDESMQIAQRWASEHPDRVRYLTHHGRATQGVSASRNLGIQHATGPYIALLDGDDVWLPEKLEQQVALLDAHPDVGLLYGRTLLWYSWDGATAKVDRVPGLGVETNVPLAADIFLTRMLNREIPSPWTCSILARKAVVDTVGGFEDEFRGMYEDQVFIAKMNLRTPILASDTCGSRYRRHAASCYSTAKADGSHRVARVVFLKWMMRHLDRRGLEGSGIWQTANRELRLARRELLLARHPLLRRLHAVEQRIARAPTRVADRLWTLASRIAPRWRARPYTPPTGQVRFGDLRRLAPLSHAWGKDRGGPPIDRVYIERFLAQHASDIRGRVLEVGADDYTRRFGGEAVQLSDVLDLSPDNPKATIVADLACAPHLASEMFDCIVLTQVLQYVEDLPAAIHTLYRVLRPGGVLLLTAPGISQISRWDMERWGEFWRFTTMSLQRLLTTEFPQDSVRVESFGNVLTAAAFLYGLAARELRPDEFGVDDPNYQLLIAARAVRPATN